MANITLLFILLIGFSVQSQEKKTYLITVQPDNKRLDYEFHYAVGNGNLNTKGSIYILGSDVYKVDTAIKGKSKYFFQLYKNGKEVYSDNPYEGLN